MTTKQHLKYLNPRVILFQKQTTNETIFKEAFLTRFENSPFAKKYYGKKMIVITKETHLARSLSHPKLFKDITLVGNYLDSQNFRSRSNKIIFYEDLPITKSQLKRALSFCKGTIDFGDFFSFSEKQIFQMTRLSLRNIKQISFIWSYMNNIHFYNNTFASLRRLEKLNITVEASFGLPANQKYCISDDYEASNLTLFMQNIVNLPRLKTLYLCFKDILMETDLALNLLLLVANSNITDWHISVMMPIEEVQNIQTLKPALAKINMLGIFTSDVSLKPDQIKAPGNSRILSLYFQESQESIQQDLRINLHPILKSCESLQALLIGSTRSQFVYKEENDSNCLTTWARNLNSVLLLAAFNYTVDGKDFSFVEEMLHKIQKESKTLINLSVHTSRICPVLKNKNWDTSTLEGYNLVCDKIIGTRSLRSIQVSLQTTHFPYLNKLASSSPNLIILDLKLSHPNSQNYWDDDLPFSQLKTLKELTIYFNSFSDQGQWGDNLAQQIATLQNLEKLSIKTLGQWSMLLSKFCIFLNNVAVLPCLKSLALDTQIIPKLQKEQQFFLVTNMMVVSLFQEIKEKIKYMIDVNRKIEFINICTFSITQLKCISYSRYPN